MRISHIKYQHVHGTSATKVAMKFDCSKDYPCSHIKLEDVNLTFSDQSPANVSCVNAHGTSSGTIIPKSGLRE